MPLHPTIRSAMSCAAVLLGLCGCGAAPSGTAAGAAPSRPPAAVQVAAAAFIERASVELLPGTVRPLRSAVLEARVPGGVGRIPAVPGQQVASGDTLVELDAQELAARRDQARALAAQAAADFERARALYDKQAMTKAEFDAVQARANGSAAAAAEAAIMAGYTVIAAPFAGVVVRRHVEVGDLLSPGRAVVEIEDPSAPRLEVEVPESLSGGLDLGTRLRAQVPAAGLDAEAPVVEIIPAVDPVSRSVLVKLALPAGTKGLRTGQFGRAAITVAGGRMLAVPAAAVVARGQLDAVFVIKDGVARMRLVRLGAADGGRISVRAGLAEGEVVAVEGAAGLRDGQSVTVR